jgi:hypothetical protein
MKVTRILRAKRPKGIAHGQCLHRDCDVPVWYPGFFSRALQELGDWLKLPCF